LTTVDGISDLRDVPTRGIVWAFLAGVGASSPDIGASSGADAA